MPLSTKRRACLPSPHPIGPTEPLLCSAWLPAPCAVPGSSSMWDRQIPALLGPPHLSPAGLQLCVGLPVPHPASQDLNPMSSARPQLSVAPRDSCPAGPPAQGACWNTALYGTARSLPCQDSGTTGAPPHQAPCTLHPTKPQLHVGPQDPNLPAPARLQI
jgi:hypothetical protein